MLENTDNDLAKDRHLKLAMNDISAAQRRAGAAE